MERSFLIRKLFPASCLVGLIVFITAGSALAAEGLTVIPNWSFLLQMANFVFLIWVLNLILYKPIRNVLKQRKEKITGLEQSIESFQKDASDKEEAFNAGLRSARVKGLEKKEGLLAEAAAEEKKVIDQINEQAQAELAQVRQQVAKDVEVARQALLKEVDGFAEAIGEKILGRAV
jgi:F-type H+-transporting ATPase subunit b